MATNDTFRLSKLASGVNAILMTVGIAGVLVVLNWVGASSYKRFDLTEGKFHSLSQVSIDVVQGMPDLEIRVYRSEKLPKTLSVGGNFGQGPQIDNVPQFLQALDDKLAEYKAASKGKLTVTYVSDDLEKKASEMNLTALQVPSAKANAGADDENAKYYLGMSIHYRTVEETIPVVTNSRNFEYDITRVLLRLQKKQVESLVLKDILDTGKTLNKAVEDCVAAVKKHDKGEKKDDDEAEGGVFEKMEQGQSDRAGQVEAYIKALPEIDAACGQIGPILKTQRDKLASETASGAGTSRALSREHFTQLLDKIGTFDGMYGAWLASLIADKHDLALLDKLVQLVTHPEVRARTSALQVLGEWSLGNEKEPGLQGPPLQSAQAAMRKGLEDTEPTVRSVAVQVLAQTAGDSAGQDIALALKDPDVTVREVALDLAMRLKLKVDPGMVRPFLKDTNWQVRRMAAAYFIDTGTGIEDLRPMLEDENPTVRIVAAYGLAHLKDKDSLAKIQELVAALPPGQNREAIEQEIQAMTAPPTPPPSPEAPKTEAPKTDAPPAPPAEAPKVDAPKADAPPPAPAPAPAPGPSEPRAPGAPPPGAPRGSKAPQPRQGGLQQALGGRAGLDRLGAFEMPDAVEGAKTLDDLKTDIASTYNTLKDSPGRKSIGVLCGHDEFCPFEEHDSKIPKELMQAFEQQPFIKKAVDDIKNLEEQMNGLNELIRKHFLSKGYRLVRVDAGKPIGEDIDALVVYGPRKPFKDIDLYDVDQFIMTGKPVVILLNNFQVAVNQWDEAPPYDLVTKFQSTDTNLDPFFAHYGIKNGKDLVMEPDKSMSEKINTIEAKVLPIGKVLSPAKHTYPLFPIFEKFSDSDPLVSAQSRVVLPFVSSLSLSDTGDKGVTVEPLITSSDNAIARDKGISFDPRTLKDAIVAEKTNGPHHVAMHATGTDVSSFFAGRARPERPKEEEKPPAEGEPPRPPKKDEPEKPQIDRGKVNLIVIGSNLGFENLSPSRILDGFNLGVIAQEKVTGLGAAVPYYIRFVDTWGRFLGAQNPIHLGGGRNAALPGQQVEFAMQNLEFLYSIFEWMNGDAAINQIRAREKKFLDRPLKIEDASTQWKVKWGLIAGLPILFILFGIGRWFLRAQSRKKLSV